MDGCWSSIFIILLAHFRIGMKFVFRMDDLPTLMPQQLKPLFRPLAPLYFRALQSFYTWIPEQTVTTAHGINLFVDPANYVERSIAKGSFESEFVRYFVDLIEELEGTTFYDIGANVGLFSLLHAKLSAGETVAFEPNPQIVDRLRENVELNPDLDIHIKEVALSDTVGETTLSVSKTYPGEASLTGSTMTDDELFQMSVRTATLDSIIDTLPDTPNLLKIDVEGAELRALSGMSEVICEWKPEILLEIHPNLIKSDGKHVSDIRELLKNFDYSHIYHIEKGNETELKNFEFESAPRTDHYHIY